jgi:hypothetical protein
MYLPVTLTRDPGAVQGRDNRVFSPLGAGVAEAVIGVALLWGAVSLARGGPAGRAVALGTPDSPSSGKARQLRMLVL